MNNFSLIEWKKRRITKKEEEVGCKMFVSKYTQSLLDDLSLMDVFAAGCHLYPLRRVKVITFFVVLLAVIWLF